MALPAGTGEDLRGDARALTAACQEMMIAGARLREGLASRTLSAWTLGHGRAGYGAPGQLGSYAKVCILKSLNVLNPKHASKSRWNCALVAFACSSHRPRACCLSDCLGSIGGAGAVVHLGNLGSVGSGVGADIAIALPNASSLSIVLATSKGNDANRADHAGLLLRQSC